MKKSFDEMTRGEQFLHLLEIEYHDLIKFAIAQVSYIRYALETYLHTEAERDNAQWQIQEFEKDVVYYRDRLKEIGGVENEASLTESQTDSESPPDRFVGVTCTTVA